MCLVDDGQLGGIVLFLPGEGRVDGGTDIVGNDQRIVVAPSLAVGGIARREARGDDVEGHPCTVGGYVGAVDLFVPVGGLVVASSGHQVADGILDVFP